MNCLASRSAAVLLFLLSIAGVPGAFSQTNSGAAKAASTNLAPASKANGAQGGSAPTAKTAQSSQSAKQCCSGNAAQAPPKPPAAAFINCHALETHTNVQPAVTIVVFNQKNRDDHVRLSELLKDQSGPVEIKTSDGKWHKATVARLKSCFGRGLLFLSGDIDEPKDKEDFLLRFPSKAAS